MHNFKHDEQIGDNIKALFELVRDKASWMPVRDVDHSRLVAICNPLNVLNHLIDAEGWKDHFFAYDESRRMVGMKVFDDLSVSQEDFVALREGGSKRAHYKIMARNVFYFGQQAQVKPPKNLWWRVKNSLGSYQLDLENPHNFAFPSRGTDGVLTVWEDDLIAPVYEDNPDYMAIRNKLVGE